MAKKRVKMMAGGSQIVINAQGITITTPGKTEFKAGQHIFQEGEKAIEPVRILPTLPHDYSRKFYIPTAMEPTESNIQIGQVTHILGLNAGDFQPIFFERLDTKNSAQQIETNRFYTDQSVDAIVHVFVDLDVMNIHEDDEGGEASG
ncbi:DUF2345 domain-containing protein [Acinetobacter rudis]|nr:DUF2345 domain-containing protein [Acinetobacter rudis]MDQ9017187.1 DUF2345 domain-containing protein [Acinetobacter rudis]